MSQKELQRSISILTYSKNEQGQIIQQPIRKDSVLSIERGLQQEQGGAVNISSYHHIPQPSQFSQNAISSNTKDSQYQQAQVVTKDLNNSSANLIDCSNNTTQNQENSIIIQSQPSSKQEIREKQNILSCLKNALNCFTSKKENRLKAQVFPIANSNTEQQHSENFQQNQHTENILPQHTEKNNNNDSSQKEIRKVVNKTRQFKRNSTRKNKNSMKECKSNSSISSVNSGSRIRIVSKVQQNIKRSDTSQHVLYVNDSQQIKEAQEQEGTQYGIQSSRFNDSSRNQKELLQASQQLQNLKIQDMQSTQFGYKVSLYSQTPNPSNKNYQQSPTIHSQQQKQFQQQLQQQKQNSSQNAPRQYSEEDCPQISLDSYEKPNKYYQQKIFQEVTADPNSSQNTQFNQQQTQYYIQQQINQNKIIIPNKEQEPQLTKFAKNLTISTSPKYDHPQEFTSPIKEYPEESEYTLTAGNNSIEGQNLYNSIEEQMNAYDPEKLSFSQRLIIQILTAFKSVKVKCEENDIKPLYKGNNFVDLYEISPTITNYPELNNFRLRIECEVSYFESFKPQSHLCKEAAAYGYYLKGIIKEHEKQFNQAITFLKQSSQLLFRHQGENYFPLIYVYQMLGHLRFRTQQYKDAEKSFKKCLKICNKRPNLYSKAIISCENQIGLIDCRLRQYKHAIHHFKLSLEIAKKYAGENSLLVGDILNYLGGAYTNRGKLNKALDRHQKALEVFLNHKNQRVNQGMGTSYLMIGGVYYDMKNYEMAWISYEKAKMIYEKLFGQTHYLIAKILVGMGDVKIREKEYDQAVELFSKALEIQINAFKAQKITEDEVAGVYNKLGSVFSEKSQRDVALQYYYKSLEIGIRVSGENSLLVGITYFNIAIIKFYENKLQESVQFHQKSLKIKCQVYGYSNQEVYSSFKSLGIAYFEMRHYQQSLIYCRKALRICDELFKGRHREAEEHEMWNLITVMNKELYKVEQNCLSKGNIKQI